MFSHDLATPQGSKANRSIRSDAILIETHDVLESHVSPFSDSPPNRKGCARWSINLLAMVHFHNFRVISRQTRTKLSGKFQKERQGWGEICGL
ncbi:hypothetical protein AA100600_1018 [Gluconobacter thailandicus F149-1 = NBRC 100600]|nr:hypothetical protein AA100600_1018 [Gluconobacter thailandicus F149-1 = NBRC 100600]